VGKCWKCFEDRLEFECGEQGGCVFRGDGYQARQWRRVASAQPDVSQRLELSLYILASCNCHFFTFSRLLLPVPCFPFTHTGIMASRRPCTSILKLSSTFSAKSAHASSSSSLRNFSSRAKSNWTCTTSPAKRRTLLRYTQNLNSATSSMHIHRQFSSTPTPRHGHLDEPKPGEESVRPT
jgi:hypothetical protein